MRNNRSPRPAPTPQRGLRWPTALALQIVLALTTLGSIGTAQASQDVTRPASQEVTAPASLLITAPGGDEATNAALPGTIPPDRPHLGLVYSGLRVPSPGQCPPNTYTFAANPTSCTHGPDPAPAGLDPKRPVPLVAAAPAGFSVLCLDNGTSGLRVQVLYVHGAYNRFPSVESTLRTIASQTDDIFYNSARETGGTRRIRYVTQASGAGCVLSVVPVPVSDASLRDTGTMAAELRTKGFGRSDRLYLVFAEATTYCGVGGFRGDDSKSPSNRSNIGPEWARADSGCWNAVVAAHELGHNLGAVNLSAPNTSRGAHCVDENDVMCYSDSPYFPAMQSICTDSVGHSRFDCRHDDYYHTNPPAGSYLATHYNVADNPFLTTDGGGGGGGGGNGYRSFSLRNARSGKCSTVQNISTAPNANLLQWTCADALHQRVVRVGQTLRVKHTGFCLGVIGASTAGNAPVVQWPCNGSRDQKWVWQGRTLRTQHTGFCLDVLGGSTAEGAQMVQWPCNGGDNQNWIRDSPRQEP